MRTHKSLERLAAAGPTEPIVGQTEQEAIFDQIVRMDRSPVRRRRPVVIALVVAGVVGAAIVAVAMRGHSTPAASTAGDNHHVPLTGVRIEAAGYHFRTPAGFSKSDAACLVPVETEHSTPFAAGNDFSAAASAEGGCVEALMMMQPNPALTIPTPVGEPVDVGSFQGYYDAQGQDMHGESAAVLYVKLPAQEVSTYLVLFAQGLTKDQLIAVAESGLSTYDLTPTTTTGTESG